MAHHVSLVKKEEASWKGRENQEPHVGTFHSPLHGAPVVVAS